MPQYILPPKKLQWPKTLEHTYTSSRKQCLVSGASFTSGTDQLQVAASWPGYVYERCSLDNVVDMSYPGINNEYISHSITSQIEAMSNDEKLNTFVVVMWSGLNVQILPDQKANLKESIWPIINGRSYQPVANTHPVSVIADNDYQLICSTGEFLKANQIPYAFTYYANILFPPILPRPDGMAQLYKNIDHNKIKILKNYNLIPADQKNYLYDYTFFNDQFDDDGYHPNIHCRLSWTDQVLLPELEHLGILQKR